jgi:ATP-dependent Clp protease protease subunit
MSEEVDLPQEVTESLVLADPGALNTIGLIGDVTEETSNELIFSLLMMKEKQELDYYTALAVSQAEEDVEEPEKPDINFYISTNGGSADEMFAIYDVMRLIKSRDVTSVCTYGLGKVMSAGVLLLAAGTKGKRRVGKHCRVMIHSVIGGSTGPMHQLENEFSEVKKIQDNYISALVSETNMTEEYLRDLLKKKINVYLSAEEAVELGIADEVC